LSKDAITNIAQGASAENEEDHAIMLLCCDKKPPPVCCKDKLKTLDFIKTGVNYTDQQKQDVCFQASRRWCNFDTFFVNHTFVFALELTDLHCYFGFLNLSSTAAFPMIKDHALVCQNVSSCFTSQSHSYNPTACAGAWINETRRNTTWAESFSCTKWASDVVGQTCSDECDYLFRGLYPTLSDKAIGGILLVISLAILCLCLVCIVKLLHSLLQGPMAMIIKKFINADFPGCFGYFTGYLAILIGAGLTIVVQSSSIFTSTLTPLVGIGVIELERMYPLTLGSNIGTTTTAILSALASPSDKMKNALQVSFCHLFFNITGIVIFYPIPALRFPLPLARFLGNRTAKYRWFAIVYILVVFFLMPGLVFALSVPGWYVLLAVLGPVVVLAIIVCVIKCLQEKRPEALPAKLQNWKFLPLGLRSLEPYDRVMQKVFFCKRFKDQDSKAETNCKGTQQHTHDVQENVTDNTRL
ncbi:unnamed protein product, partial [Candidula unifasciata]